MQHAFGVRECAMLQNHYSKDYRDKLAFLFESYLLRSIASALMFRMKVYVYKRGDCGEVMRSIIQGLPLVCSTASLT
jgi:hypothetical protein